MRGATYPEMDLSLQGLDQPVRHTGRHILLVEDYAINEQMVSKILQYAGFDVTTAASGVILDIVLREGVIPDMFILDLMLPGEHGISILRRLRKDPRFAHTPIVALTAYKFSPRDARRLGFDGYIRKPLDMARFSRTIKRYFPDLT